MAFKILPKFKADSIRSKNLDKQLLKKYYKSLEDLLIVKTNAETTTDYFFCEDYSDAGDLLIMGIQTESYKSVFRNAAKGKDGFDKTKVSIGSCFILEEGKKKILCIQPNVSLAKGKKAPVVKALKKIKRSFMKKIHDVRWLTAPVIVDAKDPSKVDVIQDEKAPQGGQTSDEAPIVDIAQLEKDSKNIDTASRKLNNEVVPRYKEGATTANDAAFINALRKTSLLFLTNVKQTDTATSKKFARQQKRLEKNLSKWKKLEAKIQSRAARKEMKQTLMGVVKRMNATRSEIRTILKRVHLKKLG